MTQLYIYICSFSDSFQAGGLSRSLLPSPSFCEKDELGNWGEIGRVLASPPSTSPWVVSAVCALWGYFPGRDCFR